MIAGTAPWDTTTELVVNVSILYASLCNVAGSFTYIDHGTMSSLLRPDNPHNYARLRRELLALRLINKTWKVEK